MASGDTLFVLHPGDYSPPASDFATYDFILELSTPNAHIPCLDFDGSSDEHADWFVTIPSWYSETTGFTFSFKYAMDGTDGDAIELEIRALHLDDLDDLDTDLGIDGQTATLINDDPSATDHEMNYSTTGTMAKANFGSASPGDFLVIRVTRDVSYATNTDDLQLIEVYVTET